MGQTPVKSGARWLKKAFTQVFHGEKVDCAPEICCFFSVTVLLQTLIYHFLQIRNKNG